MCFSREHTVTWFNRQSQGWPVWSRTCASRDCLYVASENQYFAPGRFAYNGNASRHSLREHVARGLNNSGIPVTHYRWAPKQQNKINHGGNCYIYKTAQLTPWHGLSAVGGPYASSRQISSKSVKRLQRYGDLTVLKMAAVRHLGFVRFEFFNDQSG